MLAVEFALGVAVVVGAGLVARRAPAGSVRSLEHALDARLAPLVVAALTALLVTWMWGSLAQPAVIHDEAAYLLQARIFASGQLAAPAPALPEFFEQYHVMLDPRLAPKYLPGHALVLLPGVWLGLPGLMPVLLAGIAAGLLYGLARRLGGCWVAALCWMVWLTAPADNVWRCTYLSESTSSVLWLGTSWLLLRWWESGRARDLVLISLGLVGLALTRPVTAIAFVIPVGAVVVLGVWRRKAFASLGTAVAAGLLVLCIVPVWNAASTLDWRVAPYAEYSRVYFPYQKLGFGIDRAPALRPLPADMATYDATYRRIHGAHTVNRLPRTALDRLVAVGLEFFAEWRAALALFLAIGLLRLSREVRFALAATLALFAVHLVYAHPLDWLIYYYEAHTFLAFAVALGLWRVLVGLSDSSRAPVAAAALLAIGLALGARDAVVTRETVQHTLRYHQVFARAIAKIADAKAIVFVRYAADHDPNYALVENPPDYERARVWVVYDRGADNARLLALAPERVPYLFDEASNGLYPLDAAPPS